VHAGNGTEEILTGQRSPAYQYISIHNSLVFPKTGDPVPELYPYVLNIPTRKVTQKKFREAWGEIEEAVEAFRPDIILLSAGFDAHRNDPQGNGKLNPYASLSAEDYYDAVGRIVNLAKKLCLGRLVCVMEGGYCCRPTDEDDGAAAVAMAVDSTGDDSDQDTAVDVRNETLRHCVVASCRALAGLDAP
jgi:acetoin utilization deacetylase AcuC-like enzyme